MRDTVDGINEKAWERAMSRQPRKVYVSESMPPTRRDRDNRQTQIAVAHLVAAQYARACYDQELQAAILAHGDRPTGTGFISGIYSDHFPEPVKIRLRFYARLITEQTDYAQAAWGKAGRQFPTFRNMLYQFRELPDGRVSYY